MTHFGIEASEMLAVLARRHHGARVVPLILLLLILGVVGVVLWQRRRDRRPLHDGAPRSLDHEGPTERVPEEPREVSARLAAPETAPVHRERAKHLPAGRYGMVGLLRSEWRKLRTVRSTMWTLGITVVLGIGIGALVTGETSGQWSTMSIGNQLSFEPISSSLVGLFVGQFAIGVLGALVMSAEYGTGTIRATFSAAPRRPMVLGAKAVVFGVVALLVAEAVAFIAFFLGQALLSAPAPHATLGSPTALRSVVGGGIYVCVLGLFSLGLASIIRHTAGAISAFVSILLVLPLIVQALPTSLGDDIRRYLPDRIGANLISLHSLSGSFSPWTGLLVLGGYAAAALIIGAVLLERRDA